MGAATVTPKTSRIDLRMEDGRKAAYEEAARCKGQPLAQWIRANLDEAAARDIDEARSIRLSEEQFERFCEAVEQPMPRAFRDLVEWRPQWA